MYLFPKLKRRSVALMWLDAATGHVLDKEFKLRVCDDQEIYQVFDSLENAVSFAKKVLVEKEDLECIIYDNNKEVLCYLDSNFPNYLNKVLNKQVLD